MRESQGVQCVEAPYVEHKCDCEICLFGFACFKVVEKPPNHGKDYQP